MGKVAGADAPDDGTTAPDAQARRPPVWRLSGTGLLAIGVAAAIYAAGRLIQPSYAFTLLGADPVPVKALLATVVVALAGIQVLIALWMYRKLPLAPLPPRPVPVVHRVTGYVLVAVTVPVAVHCMIAYGVQVTSLRVAVHSIAGCFFYGAFAAKLLIVHSRRLTGWALPVAGGAMTVIIGVLWYTSALWFYDGYHLPA